MNRIQQIDPASAAGKSKQLLEAVQSKLGLVPNLTRVLANSPAALDGYLSFSGALATGVLSARIREQIALAVAQANHCDYCLSAHTFIGGKVGLSVADISAARQGAASQQKESAILTLASSIVVQRGEISDATMEKARSSGLSDTEIVETAANVALNIFTNYVNHVAQTVVDFPEVKASELASAGECLAACGCQH